MAARRSYASQASRTLVRDWAALLRRRSLAELPGTDRVGAFIVEQADRDLRPRRGLGSATARARAASSTFVRSMRGTLSELNARGHRHAEPASNRENRTQTGIVTSSKKRLDRCALTDS